MKGKKPPMASRSRRRWCLSIESLGAVGLPRTMPKSKQLLNLEGNFTVSE